jgi:hypothetical protein
LLRGACQEGKRPPLLTPPNAENPCFVPLLSLTRNNALRTRRRYYLPCGILLCCIADALIGNLCLALRGALIEPLCQSLLRRRRVRVGQRVFSSALPRAHCQYAEYKNWHNRVLTWSPSACRTSSTMCQDPGRERQLYGDRLTTESMGERRAKHAIDELLRNPRTLCCAGMMPKHHLQRRYKYAYRYDVE